MSIVSRNRIKVDGYEVKLKNDLKFYYGDTLNLSFSISNKVISQICSYQITDGTLLLDKDKINAYMIVENKEIAGTIVENNCVIFRLEPKHQTIGISRLQIILKERTESGEVDVLHTPPFNIEIREPLAYTGYAPAPSDNAIVNRAIVNESLVVEATPFTWSLGDDLEYEMTVWVGGDIITDEKLNKIEMQLLKYARVITEQSSIIDEQSLVLDRHEEMLQELMYTPIAISNLSLSQSLVEIGGSVVGLQINWSANKPPITAYINGEEISSSENNYIYPYEITQDKTFTLKVTDDKGSAERSVSIKFANGKYYGVAQEGVYDSDFILSLNKQIVTNGKGDITVNCDSGEYVYYAIPTRFDTPRFSVGGFVGGFTLVDTIEFTNVYGYTEDYEIWKSENSNLGLVTINVG